VIEFAFEKSPCKRPDGYMFLSKRGRRAPGGGITTDGGNIRLKRILARFGMAGFTTHSMRKACATNAFNEWGGDFQALLLVKEMLQHSSIDTTVRYIGLNDSRINEFYNAL
jgi:integrase